MRYIHKLFYENDSKSFEDIYNIRFHFDSTIHLSLSIKPMNQSNIYELYYTPTNEMLEKVSKVYKISREFNATFKRLPRVARNQFINECLVEELYNTNELEGVKSTREEIARSAKNIRLNKNTRMRFESMIKSYLGLFNGEIELPKTPQDIRKIYDEITSGEIDEQELPDGEIFRRDTTNILKKSGTGKVIHQGITPESKIIYQIEKLLEFMNGNEDVPMLIKVAVGHFYFGYIHPFYDGNGRTSRFISSLYLSKDLDIISTLSLSRGCNKYRNKYLESFEITNSIKSKGEMNSFIETFLDILIEALSEMNGELKEKHELLNIVLKKIKNEPKLFRKSNKHKDIMFILAQNHFFDLSKGLTIKELAEIYDKSDVTIRKVIKELQVLGLIEKQGERPAFYSIKQQYFEL